VRSIKLEKSPHYDLVDPSSSQELPSLSPAKGWFKREPLQNHTSYQNNNSLFNGMPLNKEITFQIILYRFKTII